MGVNKTRIGPDRIGSDRIGLSKPGPDWTGLTKPGRDVIRRTKPGSDPKKSINSRQNSHVISLIEYGTEKSKETFVVFLFRQYYIGKKFCYSVTLLMIFFPRGKDQDARARYEQENCISGKNEHKFARTTLAK